MLPGFRTSNSLRRPQCFYLVRAPALGQRAASERRSCVLPKASSFADCRRCCGQLVIPGQICDRSSSEERLVRVVRMPCPGSHAAPRTARALRLSLNPSATPTRSPSRTPQDAFPHPYARSACESSPRRFTLGCRKRHRRSCSSVHRGRSSRRAVSCDSRFRRQTESAARGISESALVPPTYCR